MEKREEDLENNHKIKTNNKIKRQIKIKNNNFHNLIIKKFDYIKLKYYD